MRRPVRTFEGREVNSMDTFSKTRAFGANKKRCIRTNSEILRYLLTF